FINKYRIEEAKSLLFSEKFNHLNILGIAFQSGFNSKTTFNITFKKHTGLSPTDYVKSQR
ncbi:helix-turn-helix domain-containing protein, partial [Nostoc sp. CHAB 5824]|nr:helix-turn-helix domain-containing protein [Nostoc sp. CHAB 5824]